MADVGSPLSPGLFQGSIDGVKAWADVRQRERRTRRAGTGHRRGGRLEAQPRRGEERHHDRVRSSSLLLGTDRAVPERHAPGRGLQGQGRRDHRASPTSRCSRPNRSSSARRSRSRSSPTARAVRTRARACVSFQAVTPAIEWFKKNVTKDLHGIFVIPNDLPSTITSSTPLFKAIQDGGVKLDAAVRRQRSLDPVAVHAGRAGDQGEQRRPG